MLWLLNKVCISSSFQIIFWVTNLIERGFPFWLHTLFLNFLEMYNETIFHPSLFQNNFSQSLFSSTIITSFILFLDTFSFISYQLKWKQWPHAQLWALRQFLPLRSCKEDKVYCFLFLRHGGSTLQGFVFLRFNIKLC